MGRESIHLLPSKIASLITVMPKLCLGITVILACHYCRAQGNLSRWEFGAQGTLYPPISTSLDSGIERLKGLPCPGWNIRISYRIVEAKRTEVFLYYSRGSTPYAYNINLYQDRYPQLRSEVEVKVLTVQHPFHVVGAWASFVWKDYYRISGFIGNRFYLSTHTGYTIGAPDATTLQNMVVLRAETETTFRFFCPEFNVAYSGPFWKRFPFLEL